MRLARLLVIAACLGAAASQPAALPVVHIVLAGDSTVTAKVGWGNGFTASLSHRAEVTNLAESGRSTKSYLDEGWWKQVLAAKPDYVLIQFGHNDQKPDAARHTDPDTTYRQYLARFVTEARAAGIRPVLVTSLSRRDWGPDGKIHSSLLAYVSAAKAEAAKDGVPLLDLHARSIELYERLGKAEVDTMSPRLDGKVDNTHLNAKGSATVGPLVAVELAKVVPDLAPYVEAK
jgi:lysophospholipase L1-like esterase